MSQRLGLASVGGKAGVGDWSGSWWSSPVDGGADDSIPADDQKKAAAAVNVAVPALRPRSEVLAGLARSRAHRIRLAELEEEEARMTEAESRMRREMQRHKRDVYEVAALYALLQGVLYAAVAQASNLRCGDAWAPAGLSLAVAAAAALAAADKLRLLRRLRRRLALHRRRRSAVFSAINNLRYFGADADLDLLRRRPSALPNLQSRPLRPPNHSIAAAADSSSSAVAWLLFFLGFALAAAFSLVLLLSCTSMLCSACTCS